LKISIKVNSFSNSSAQVSASMFVGKTDGKLRDYYRIGKILGTGRPLFYEF
jgi:hypothetical protein